jgi:uncharacterized delta-60 repeat protein
MTPRIARHTRSKVGAAALVGALALIGQPSLAPAAAESATTATAAGSLDLSFDGDGKAITQIGSSTDQGNAVARQPDGRIVVAGFSESGTGLRFAVVRYNPDGSLDPSFDGDGKITTAIGTGHRDEAYDVALQPDGKIVVAGDSYDPSGKPHFAVVRYNADGSLDPSFDGDGMVTTTIIGGRDLARAVAVQGDGRIVVAGNSALSTGGGGFVALARYNPDGSLDTSFNDDEVSCASCSADTPSGTVVTTVGFGGSLDAVAIQADGRIVVAGRTSGFNTDIVVLRYTPDGGLDGSFGPVGTTRPGTVITDIGLQTGGAASHDIATSLDLAGGRIVVAGFTQSSSGTRIAVTRYLGGGALDSTFGGDGIVTTAAGPLSQGFGVGVDDAGRTVVAGVGSSTTRDLALVRYGTDGSLDPTFGSGGIVLTPVGAAGDEGRGLALQPDGRIVVAGFSHSGSGIQDDFLVARYHGDAPATDTTPPTVECGSADGAWHAADVSIACTASDAESGLADADDASFSLSTNVAAGTEDPNASTNSRQACDNAGNCATAGPIAGNMVDKRDPAVSIIHPGEETYLLNQVVSASYSCADGGSGIASCSAPVADGTPLDTSTVGPRSFTVTATDNAGNDASLTHDYRIVYPFGGFQAPVDGEPTLNTTNAGSVIPVKFTLGGDHGLGILAPGSPSSTRFDCGTAADLDEIEETDSVGSGLSYDPDTGAYKYTWKTSKAWAGTCRAFDLELADGTHHQALFSFH